MTERRDAMSVSEFNECVKMLLEGNPNLRDVWVSGELSGVKVYSSGHMYFSIKDRDSVVSAVMFRSSVVRLGLEPEDGMKVLVHGRVSVYPPRGQYQFNADRMEPDGAGALAIAFEQLKSKLSAEGLFDPARKKPLPAYPKRIGVITSASGAAVHDIIRVARGRYPTTEILLFPSLVQGPEAPAYLAGGIQYFNTVSEGENYDPEQAVDLIIIGRGGGSAEDLWCFNDERLARTVAWSRLPVISAVGHEVDFTICDFVADVRAATPSAAAEIALPDGEELLRHLQSLNARMTARLTGKAARYRTLLDRLSSSRVLASPEAAYTHRRELIATLGERLDHSMVRVLTGAAQRPMQLADRLERVVDSRVSQRQMALGRVAGKLEALSPLGVLSRGYALVQNEKGRVVPSVRELAVGDRATLRFADGRAEVSVMNTEMEAMSHE